jgi:plasmid maintenance system antidote protein VapI
MGKFSDHPVNRKFNHIYEELIIRNLIKSKSDLAKNLETYNHIINNILKGDRNITVDQIRLLSERYDVRPDFLFGKTNEPFQKAVLSDPL